MVWLGRWVVGSVGRQFGRSVGEGRPRGEVGEGRLDFYHRAVSKAVRLKYLTKSVEQVEEEDSAVATTRSDGRTVGWANGRTDGRADGCTS